MDETLNPFRSACKRGDYGRPHTIVIATELLAGGE